MISPMTKPGTKIVCVDDDPSAKYTVGYSPSGYLHGLTKESVYTVHEIVSDPHAASGFCVCLVEITRRWEPHWKYFTNGFDLARFDYLALPDSITSLLNIAPIDASKQLEPV